MTLKLIISLAGFFAAGALLMALGHRINRPAPGVRRRDWIKFGIFFAIVTVILLSTRIGRPVLAGIILIIVLAAVRELWVNRGIATTFCGFLAITLSLLVAAGLSHLLLFDGGIALSAPAYVFLIVACSDSFAQLTGRLLGRHRLCPVVSPNKTIEGAIGGISTAIIGAVLFGFLQPTLSISRLVLLGLIVSIAALSGDLLFSAVKRYLGIKDFSGLLPGHGGVLDRFDSLVIAAPTFYWTQRLMS